MDSSDVCWSACMVVMSERFPLIPAFFLFLSGEVASHCCVSNSIVIMDKLRYTHGYIESLGGNPTSRA